MCPDHLRLKGQAMREDLICPRPSDDCLLLPESRWEGRCVPRPWEYDCTVQIPHYETPETLETILALYRAGTARPYFLIIDTGSSRETRALIEKHRAPDCEIHHILGHGYRHASEVVCAAMDVGMTLCRTEKLYVTHADVFPMRRDLLETLGNRCTAENPVVGYRMSDRSWLTSLWEQCVSHTCTMLFMPTMHRQGLTWSYGRIVSAFGYDPMAPGGWPDTETGFNMALIDAGIVPDFIGQDVNYVRTTDENIDHVRSYPGAKLYSSEHFRHAARWMVDAIREANDRLRAWLAPGRAALELAEVR
jgi:hypothetical protein